jgi:hypothetical protein
MPSNAGKPMGRTQQDVCIDLPGETVQCWRSSDNIRVVLRKHRDVIFDLNLGTGKTYTVQATKSDFYNARDKKLVYAKRREMVTFKDGERLHLWVTRNFDGALILKCGSETLMRLTPNELDKCQYDDAPKTKPAPIIVAIGPVTPSNESATAIARPTKASHAQAKLPTPAAAPTGEDCSVVCVVDGTMNGMPAALVQHFKKGGGKSGLADIDPNEILTRNWIWGQALGVGAYVTDNWSWLRASLDSKTQSGFRLVTAKVHLVRGKVRFYFSGYSKYNQVFGPGGFGPGHDRIMSIFAGVGTARSALTSAAKSIFSTFRGYAAVSFVFGTATSYAEWKDDIKQDGYDFASTFLVSAVKAVVVAALVAAMVALCVTAIMIGARIAIPVLGVGAMTVGFGLLASYGVDAADKALGKGLTGDPTNSDGISAALSLWLRKAEAAIERNWQALAEKNPADYQGSPL